MILVHSTIRRFIRTRLSLKLNHPSTFCLFNDAAGGGLCIIDPVPSMLVGGMNERSGEKQTSKSSDVPQVGNFKNWRIERPTCKGWIKLLLVCQLAICGILLWMVRFALADGLETATLLFESA